MSKKNLKEENIIKETKYCKIMNQGKVGDDEYTYTIEKIYIKELKRDEVRFCVYKATRRVNPAKKDLSKIDNELEKLDKKRAKLFEAYEDEIITKEEFKLRKEELMKRVKALEEEKAPLLVTLSDDVNEEVPYELVKSILENFSKVLTESSTREQQKKLLHMIISEITINELREIDSIKIKLDDNLINYLSNEEGVSMKGTTSSFKLRNIGISTLNLDIAI